MQQEKVITTQRKLNHLHKISDTQITLMSETSLKL